MSTSEQVASDAVPAEVAEALRLSLVPGVGPRIRQALLERFGTPAAVLVATADELRRVPGVGPKVSRAITRARDEIDVGAELELCRRSGIRLIADTSAEYPPLLKQVCDPPAVLFCRGTLAAQDQLAIAIVGARHATHYGLAQSERLAASLARAGLTIISGMARGIDGAAHRGALSAGGRTIAVLGGGLLNIYPPEHRQLADEIAASGAILSEMPPRFEPLAGTFPQRNRLISGLTLGTIVVEASQRSGALITARHALEQGREVFAVPGRVDSRNSRGCHQLIRDGAKLVESADDVLEELGPLVSPVPDATGQTLHHPAELQLNDVERQVLAAIGLDPTPIDQIVESAGLSAAKVLSTISALEIRRLVRRVGGQAVMRV